MPKLRFPEFCEDWKEITIGEVFEKVTEKNTALQYTNVICNSARIGLIPQREYFDKDIANSDNIDGYYIIKEGDFVYNPRKSAEAPYGPVSVYNYTEAGIVSPLYLCFRAKQNIITHFYEWLFKSSTWHRYVYLSGDSGARHDRVSMKDATFFSMPIGIPCEAEQKKITSFLSYVEQRIEKQQKLVNSLKSYKRGVIFAIFKENNRFNMPMTYTPMTSLLTVYRNRDTRNLRVCSVAVQKGVVDQIEHLGRSFAASDTSNYGRVEYGDVVYTKSPTGDFPYGIVKQSKLKESVAVSPLYGVYHPITFEVGSLLHYYFEQKEYTNNYICNLAQKGAKNTINITTERFLEKGILFPTNNCDVKKLVNLLNGIDCQVKEQNSALEKLHELKRSLLSKMFL